MFKKFFVILCFLLYPNARCDLASIGALLSGVGIMYPVAKKMFDEIDELALQEITFDVWEDVNYKSAVKVVLVIIYGKDADDKDAVSLSKHFKTISSADCFADIDRMVKDHPEYIQIYKYEFVCKKLIKVEEVKYKESELKPKAAYIFANYMNNNKDNKNNRSNLNNQNNSSASNSSNNSDISNEKKKRKNKYKIVVNPKNTKIRVVLKYDHIELGDKLINRDYLERPLDKENEEDKKEKQDEAMQDENDRKEDEKKNLSETNEDNQEEKEESEND